MLNKLKSDAAARDLVTGLTILFIFCFLSYGIGFANGKEVGRLEVNPVANAIKEAIVKGNQNCADLAAMLNNHKE